MLLLYVKMAPFVKLLHFPLQFRLTCPQKLVQSYIGTLQHRLQYPVVAAHLTPTKSTKPFILGCAVIAIVLHSSVPRKACLAVCPVTLLAH